MSCPINVQTYSSLIDVFLSWWWIEGSTRCAGMEVRSKEFRTKGRNDRTTRTMRSNYGIHKRIYPIC